jgi:hypothetical protein
MSNMSYCRFQNTLSDLRDCYYNGLPSLSYDAPDELKETDSRQDKEDRVGVLSKDETDARDSLIRLCQKIVEEYGHFVEGRPGE